MGLKASLNRGIGVYAELVRQEQYDFSDDEVRPIFQPTTYCRVRWTWLVNSLASPFGKIRICQYTIRMFEFLKSGAETSDVMGVIYIDYARDSKRGGAWMSSFRSGIDWTKIHAHRHQCHNSTANRDDTIFIVIRECEDIFRVRARIA